MGEFDDKISFIRTKFRELLGPEPIDPDKLRSLEGNFIELIEDLGPLFKWYAEGHQDRLRMLGKVAARQAIEALESQFSQRYGHAFNSAFPDYKKQGVYYSRPKMWRWVLHHDQMCHGGALHNVATDNGNLNLTIRQAVDHIAQCYNWHSDLVHHKEFSAYKNIPVFHQGILEDGYREGRLPFSPGEPRLFTMNCDDSARILTGLSVHAGFDPEIIEFVRK